MKKFLAVIVVAAMVAALLVSCKKEDTSLEDVCAAVVKTDELDSYELSYELQMHMIRGDETADIPVKGSTKKAIVEGETVLEYKMTVDYGETENENVIFVKDGMAYMEISGNKMKLSAEYAAASVPMLELSQLKEENIASAELVGDVDGNKVYKVTLKEGSGNTFFDLILGTDSTENTAFSSIELELTVDANGYMTVCHVKFEASAEDEELGKYGTNADCTFTYVSPGTAPDIVLPNFDEYTDATVFK